MDAEKLNWLTEAQPGDVMFVARYVEGLFTPFRFRVTDLVTQIEITPPELTAESGIAVTTTSAVQLTASLSVIESAVSGSTVSLPNRLTPGTAIVMNKSTEDLTVNTTNGTLIEGQSSVTIPVGTSVTFYYVGDDQWYAQ